MGVLDFSGQRKPTLQGLHELLTQMTGWGTDVLCRPKLWRDQQAATNKWCASAEICMEDAGARNIEAVGATPEDALLQLCYAVLVRHDELAKWHRMRRDAAVLVLDDFLKEHKMLPNETTSAGPYR
jgi:hypothetical protein